MSVFYKDCLQHESISLSITGNNVSLVLITCVDSILYQCVPNSTKRT
jgi:hypothetical protein